MLGSAMSLIALLISLGCLFHLSHCATKPNIIFFLADDLGWHDVGYHDSMIKTPNIDKLAAEGVKLENYYVTPLCSPSRAVLMTGKYQTRTAMQHHVLKAQEPRCLPLDEVTMPQALKENGYTTYMVGKWHLGFCYWNCTPTHRGFDKFFGMYLAAGDYFHHTRTCHGRTDECYDLHDNDESVGHLYYGQYSTTLYAEKAQDFIRKHDPETPLFLYLSFQAVHAPLQVPQHYISMYRDIYDQDVDRMTYAAMTTCMDEAIGNVTQALKESGLLNNSIIVFSTDNGGAVSFGASNWPLKGHKGTVYEGGVRGPAFVWSPYLKPHVKGTMNNELLFLGDWMPTFVHLANGTLKNAESLDGVNQWATISENKPSARHEILHNIDQLEMFPSPRQVPEAFSKYSDFNINVVSSIRIGRWKLVTGNAGDASWIKPPEMGYYRTNGEHVAVQLYNIPADPEERMNLVPYRPDVVYRLLQRLKFHYDRSVVPVDLKPELKEADPVLHFNKTWTPWKG